MSVKVSARQDRLTVQHLTNLHSHLALTPPSMTIEEKDPDYACRCLNVRIRLNTSEKTKQERPSFVENYESIFVGEGIVVAHNELTLRSRSSKWSDNKCTQYITVTCLVCNITVYRVAVIVPPDSEAKEGPIMPTEDWVEQDVLLSKNGWIEVHIGKSGCIGKQEIKQLLSSPSYLERYSLALVDIPVDHLSSSTPITLPESKLDLPPSHQFLPELPAFLPPPPFTPSHPIFRHLASIATSASDILRKTACENIEEYTRRELARVEEQECKLRAQVEHLWRNVRECLNKAQEDKDKLSSSLRHKRRSLSPGSRTSTPDSALHVVRNFTPTTRQPPRPIISSSAPHHSALSSSLASSSFHHPSRTASTNGQSVVGATSRINDTVAVNSALKSGTSLSPPSPEGLSIASRSLRRNMDMENDTIVTFRWSAIEEEEKRVREQKKRDKAMGNAHHDNKNASNSKGLIEGKNPPSSVTPTKATVPSEVHSSMKDSQKKSPGKRKVTFNVEPSVVTIKDADKDNGSRTEVVENDEETDLIFDFDSTDASPGPSSSMPQQSNGRETKDTSGLIFTSESSEQRQENTRGHGRSDSGTTRELPNSFAALRPASLPLATNTRPEFRNNISNLGSPQSTPKAVSVQQQEKERSNTSISEVLSFLPHQKELLEHLGAGTSIHRGSWQPNSKSWSIFGASDTVVEDGEDSTSDTEYQDGKQDAKWRAYQLEDVPRSLPLPIAPIAKQSANGIKPTDQKTPSSDKASVPNLPLPSIVEEDEKRQTKSAVANRQEAYAKRDRARNIDSGLLEFNPGDNDVGDSDSDLSDEDIGGIATMSRSQRNALKIIRGAESLPSEGWRSLTRVS